METKIINKNNNRDTWPCEEQELVIHVGRLGGTWTPVPLNGVCILSIEKIDKTENHREAERKLDARVFETAHVKSSTRTHTLSIILTQLYESYARNTSNKENKRTIN